MKVAQGRDIGTMLYGVVAFIMVCLTAPVGHATPSAPVYKLGDGLDITEIAKDVHMVTHRFPWPANSLIARVDDHTVYWIDTPYTDDATQSVYDWIRSHYGDARLIEINTGFHNDNLGGNGFLASKGVPIYGSHLTVTLLREREPATRREILKWLAKPKFEKYREVFQAARYIPPTKLFSLDQNRPVRLSDGAVEIYFPGSSHADDNVVVYLARHKVLFGGCMVKSRRSTKMGFIGDADLASWPGALERVLNRYPDARFVVPGHGEVGNLDLISHTIRLLRAHGGAD